MRVYVIVLSILFSLNIMACPDLAGNYSCTYKNETGIVVVDQGQISGVPAYNIDNISYIMDGATHTFTDEQVSGVYAATCSGTAIKITMSMDAFDEDIQDFVRIDGEMIFSATTTGYLQILSGVAKYGRITTPIHEVNECTRIP